MRAMKRGGCTCVARRAATTATATKRARRRKVSRGSRFVSSTATATIGPNSPMAPTDKTEGPTGVCSTPASRRIGRSVPSAVVVRQRATTTWSSTSPVARRTTPTASASTRDVPHEPTALPRWPWRMIGEVELGAGQEHQIGQPEIGQRRHDVVRVGQVEHIGTEQDPEDDLDHDLGYGDEPARPFGDDRRKDRRQPDEDQRGNRSFFDHVSSLRPVTARCGTPRHLRRHTLRATCPEAGDSEGLTAP